MPRIGKSTEMESRLVVTRGGDRRREMGSDWSGAYFWCDEIVELMVVITAQH